MSPVELTARMGELVASCAPADILVSIGLGSCIGLALIDRRSAVAGLAHIMLPDSGAGSGSAAKFADSAVPALVEAVVARGALRSRLESVLVGGASMFTLGASSALDVGARNEMAVREALAVRAIRIRAAATGGSRGRTIRVHVGTGTVIVKEAGGVEEELLAPRPSISLVGEPV
jgi:chemotaxis protein CheD